MISRSSGQGAQCPFVVVTHPKHSVKSFSDRINSAHIGSAPLPCGILGARSIQHLLAAKFAGLQRSKSRPYCSGRRFGHYRTACEGTAPRWRLLHNWTLVTARCRRNGCRPPSLQLMLTHSLTPRVRASPWGRVTASACNTRRTGLFHDRRPPSRTCMRSVARVH